VPFRGLRIALLVSGIISLLVFAGMAPANAAVTASSGSGLTVTVVSARLVNKFAVNVKFAVSCTTANDVRADGGVEEIPPDTYNLLFGFTLSENIKGTITSYQSGIGSGGSVFFFPPITCNGTSQAFTDTLLPQNCTSSGCTIGTLGYKPGPAFITSLNVSLFDSDASCGINPAFNFPNPCDSVNNVSGGVQITG
jgi:hypothetical protein